MMRLQEEEMDALRKSEQGLRQDDAQDVSGLKPRTPPGRRLRAGIGWLVGQEDLGIASGRCYRI
ncbi:hypothetical protein BMI79_18515 [Serratia oryzae]|uniref:Uncharacterized protein n=1 Tax=Serratia oryzae TaxID=2034155 RepID=A0A1S8CFI1_9GAMM|nr:hypothetical protein BMI79_18515 [Serratia oryzae]